MSSNTGFLYSGTLTFNGPPIVTPMIECLFGSLVNENFTVEDGATNTVNFRQEEERYFSELANAFNENAQKLGIFDGKKRNANTWITCLSRKFNFDISVVISGTLDSIDEDDDTYDENNDGILEPDFLHKLAHLCNDGHNLHSIEYNYSFNYGRGVSDSGGGAAFISNQLNYYQYSHDILSAASRIDEYFLQKNFKDAGFVIAREVHKFYEQLSSKDKSAVLDSIILHLQNNKNDLVLLDSVNEPVNEQNNKKFRP